MANQEHLDLLRQGVKIWNQWRKEHPDIEPDLWGADLQEADLREADLSGANLRRTNLFQARLSYAHLTRADLFQAQLNEADFTGAHLFEVDLSLTNLSHVYFEYAHLDRTNLRDANLSYAELNGTSLREVHLNRASLNRASLNGTDLTGADFTQAAVAYTVFGNVDLSRVKGLDTIKHDGPSTIGIDTIIKSQGKIPETFLRKAGVPPSIIEQIPALVGSLEPIQYYTCFISYSSKDQDFADRLYADLQAKGVRCWFAPHHLKTGDRYRDRIEESIRVYDKLLLILSEHAVASTWVEEEVEKAMDKERQLRAQGYKRTVLFPIKLDDTVLQTTKAWAADVRRMWHIGDFINWHDYACYQRAFTRLLNDLKSEA